MKKATMVWLTVAASLVLAGLVTVTCALAVAQWDFTNLSSTKLETNTHEITEVYQNISVATDTADVVFIPCEGEKTSVVCHESVKEAHRVEVRDGTLCIELVDTREWYDYINIGINFDSPKITVYLPRGEYAALTLKGSTCDVEIPDVFSFESLDIAVSTGDVTCSASVTGSMKIKASTGDIKVGDLLAGELALSVSTGEVSASAVAVEGDLSIRVSTGKSYLTDVTCKNFTSTGNTGDITMIHVVVAEKTSITRSTGDVKFDRCDASELIIKTDTGDVTGTLLSEKVFIHKTDTGDVDLPDSTTGGRCEITTDTGDIRISIVG